MNVVLETSLSDLTQAIRSCCFGEISNKLIRNAGMHLIQDWNEFNPNNQIDVDESLREWFSIFIGQNPHISTRLDVF